MCNVQSGRRWCVGGGERGVGVIGAGGGGHNRGTNEPRGIYENRNCDVKDVREAEMEALRP